MFQRKFLRLCAVSSHDDINKALRRLGIPSSDAADTSLLKKAYHRQVQKCHPDAGGSDFLMKEVIQAYEILQKVSKDQWRHIGSSSDSETSVFNKEQRVWDFEQSQRGSQRRSRSERSSNSEEYHWPPPLYLHGRDWARDLIPKNIFEAFSMFMKVFGIFILYKVISRVVGSLIAHHDTAMRYPLHRNASTN